MTQQPSKPQPKNQNEGASESKEINRKFDQMVSIGIPVPRFSGLTVDASEECLKSLIDMIDHSMKLGLRINIIPRPVGRGLHVAKNHTNLADNLEGDWLLVIGSDHSFGPDALALLIDGATDDDGNVVHHIIGGITSSRMEPYRLIAYKLDPSGKSYMPVRPHIDFTEADCIYGTVKSEPGLATGSGFCLYHRTVFDVVPYPWFDGGTRLMDLGNYGPDIRICAEAALRGLSIAIHYGVMYLHHEPQPIHPARYIHWINRNPLYWMAEIHQLNNEGTTEEAVQHVVREWNKVQKAREEAIAKGDAEEKQWLEGHVKKEQKEDDARSDDHDAAANQNSDNQ